MPIYHAKTIPLQFIKFDTAQSLPDEYINARDMHVFWENHNILLARRQKRVLFAMGNMESVALGVLFVSARPANVATGDVLMTAPLHLSPHVKEVTVSFFGQSYPSGTVYIFPVISGPDTSSQLNTSLAVTNTRGTFSVDVPVPPSAALAGRGRLTIYIGGGSSGADVVAGLTIQSTSGFAPRSIDVDVTTGGTPGTPVVNDVGYFSNANIEERLVTNVDNLGGNISRVWFDDTLNIMPIPGTTTFSTKNALGIRTWGISVYEKAVTDFDADPGVLY